MNNKLRSNPSPTIRNRLREWRYHWSFYWEYYGEQLANFINRYWFRMALAAAVIFIVLRKDVTIQLNLSNKGIENIIAPQTGGSQQTAKLAALPAKGKEQPKKAIKAKPVDTKLRRQQLAYVNRFQKVAVTEMHKYGIPASITLAQGLLETRAGQSPLATKNNNHFGMKCFSRTCRKGHCSNFSDDTHKDFFRKYNTAWESYRAHSKLLVGKRYRSLQQHGKQDYRSWAYGLKKAGYATDPRYPEKLIALIEALDLQQYDLK